LEGFGRQIIYWESKGDNYDSSFGWFSKGCKSKGGSKLDGYGRSNKKLKDEKVEKYREGLWTATDFKEG